MTDTTSTIAQANAGMLPRQWSDFRARPDSGRSVLLGFGVVGAGVWVIGGLIWALIPSLGQRLFSSSLDIPLGWWFLAEALLILVPAVYLLIRPWIRPGMVIIADEEAIEYLPERWLQRVRIFDFATIQGMVVHVHYIYGIYGETNMRSSTHYGVELRDAQGKQCWWSFTRPYGHTREDTGAVYEQIIEHFERQHTNHTEGLSTHSSDYMSDYMRE